MYKESWGLKRICPMCSKQYYDLGRIKLECPECGKEIEVTTMSRPRRGRKPGSMNAAPLTNPIPSKPKEKDEDLNIENLDLESSEETIEWLDREVRVGSAARQSSKAAIILYRDMLDVGVAPEQARMVLPQNVLTEWYWTGSLYAFARVCNLRCQPDAQKETRDICWNIDQLANVSFPISWEALRGVNDG